MSDAQRDLMQHTSICSAMYDGWMPKKMLDMQFDSAIGCAVDS